MTRLGKMARWPLEMREGLDVRLRGASGRRVRRRGGQAGPGMTVDRAGASIKANQTDRADALHLMVAKGAGREGAARCTRGACAPRSQTGPGMTRHFAEASFKANQTCGASGQWLVVSGQRWMPAIQPSQTKSNPIKPNQTCGGEVGDEARPHPDALHEDKSKKEPPRPDPHLHKCVEEGEMKRCARVHGFNARSFSANPLLGERELICVIGRGGAGGFAGTPLSWSRPNGTNKTNRTNVAGLNQIKLNQSCGGEGSGQWLVPKNWGRLRPNQAKSNHVEPAAREGKAERMKDESRSDQTMPQPWSQTQSNRVKRAGAKNA